MSTWSNNQSVCATCRYWNGRRNIDFTAIFFEAIEDRGRCQGPLGSYNGLETNESTWCNMWEGYRNI